MQLNGRSDILAANALAHALYSEAFLDPRRPVNPRFTFLDPRAPTCRDPYDRALSDLDGELSTRSETFRTL